MIKIEQRLQSLMEQRGINKTELYRATGIKRTTLLNYLSGANVPPLDSAVKLALFFKVSLDYLVMGSDTDLIAGLQKEISNLNKTIQEQDKDIVQLRQFIIEHLERQSETTRKTQQTPAKRINQFKGKKD